MVYLIRGIFKILKFLACLYENTGRAKISLLLIQEAQLSVSGESVCTKLSTG